MDELTFLGVDDSGDHLLLQDAAGTRYTVAVTPALTTALRRRPEHAVSAAPEVAVTPREVQAMIRAGASIEEVAEASGWSTDKIGRYEAPILAERGHVAGLARGAFLPSFGRGSSPTLEKRVKERLVMRGLRPDDAWWDAWRQDGTPWAVSLSFEAGGRTRTAVWHFDPMTSALTPQDDEARWLSTAEEDGFEDDAPAAAQEAPAAPGAGHEPVSHARTTRGEAGGPLPTAPGTSRGQEGEQAGDEHADEADRATDGSGDHRRAQSPETTPEHDAADEPAPQEPTRTGGAAVPEPVEEPQEREAPLAPRQRSQKRRGRPSVPSWDDIMFGGSKG